MRRIVTAACGVEKCLKVNGDIQALIVDGAKQCGESMGRMLTVCSEKALKLLSDDKLSNDEKISRLTQLVADYMK